MVSQLSALERGPHLRFLRALSQASLIALLLSTFNSSLASTYHPKNGLQSENQVPIIVDITAYGAKGDGVADDGPAFQGALDHLANAGGGTLMIPAGKYAIVSPISKNFSGTSASGITIRGVPSNTVIDASGNSSGLDLTSELIIKTGGDRDALTLSGLDLLLIQDIEFKGVDGALTDAHITLSLSSINIATVEHCEFYGLSSLDGGYIIGAYDSDLRIQHSAYLGCSTNSATNSYVIQNANWRGVSVTDTKFVDYGVEDFYSKTPYATPYSWIGIDDIAPKQSSSDLRNAVLRNLFLDEGGWLGISSRPYYSPLGAIDLIYMADIYLNVSNQGTAGVYLFGAKDVLIENSYFGWSHNTDSAIDLHSIGSAVLSKVTCDPATAAFRIRADKDTRNLSIINSLYGELQSEAQNTRVITPDSPIGNPIEYVKQQYQEVLQQEPTPARLSFWTNQLLNCSESAVQCRTDKEFALSNYLVTTSNQGINFGTNPADSFEFFVREQYWDFLSRTPDDVGFSYWKDQVTRCGTDQKCINDRRIEVSDAFFFEPEFQESGAYVYRIYRAVFGQLPAYADFMSDRRRVIGGTELDASKTAFTISFVQRDEFLQLYPETMTADQFVTALLKQVNDTSGVDLSQQQAALAVLYDGTDNGRAKILRQVADDQSFIDAEYRRSFVLMGYFGYLRRDPDQEGFNFWLGLVNSYPVRDVNIQHAMVCSFITSAEYQLRFGSIISHSNKECPQ